MASNRASEVTGAMLDVNGNVIPRATPSGLTLAAGGLRTPNVDGFLSPKVGASASAFCTSSEDVLTAFNFSSDDDQSSFGYEQVNNRESQNTAKITLVCGDLFRKVARNINTLASILLEPQNKVLLSNFLEDFNGIHLVPWAVGASLRHWARKFSLTENDEDSEYSCGLPYLKTSQNLTPMGYIDDPGALDRLEKTVDEYLKKIEAEGPFQQACQSLGTLMDFICDTDAIQETDAASTSVSSTANVQEPNLENLPRPHSRREEFQEAYQNILEELRLAEAEIVELQAEADRIMSPKPPSENILLHRIAGFDSFVGLMPPSMSNVNSSILGGPESSKASQTDMATLFPSKSSRSILFASGFSKSASKLCTPLTSQYQLGKTFSPTMLASASRTRFVTGADENENQIAGSTAVSSDANNEESVEEVSQPKTSSEIFSENGEEIANDIVQRMWKDDPTIFEFASELERSTMQNDENDNNEEEAETAPTEFKPEFTVTFPEVPVSQPKLSDQAVSETVAPVNQPVAAPKTTNAPATASKNPASGKSKSPKPKISKSPLKKTPPPTAKLSRPSQTWDRIAKASNSLPPQRRSAKPQIAFGAKVDSRFNSAQSFTVGHVSRKPATKTPPIQKAAAAAKVAPGCRRIEFTKVAQTVSYRQLNKESLKLLNQPVGSRVTSNPEPTGTNAVVPNPAASVKRELAQILDMDKNFEQPRDVHTAPQSSANLTTVVDMENLQPFTSTPASPLVTSRGASTTKFKPVIEPYRKPVLSYAQLRQQKKMYEQAASKTAVGKGENAGVRFTAKPANPRVFK